MDSLFEAAFFKANRLRLRSLFKGTAPIVLSANGLLQRNGTMNYPFRQDSSFWYLTGINEPDVILVMDKTKEYLIVPGRDPVRAKFDGEPGHDNLTKISGIETVLDGDTGWKQLAARLKRVKHVATLSAAPAYIEFYGLYTNPARAVLASRLQEINPTIELLDLKQHMATMRMVKQPPELAALKRAIDITAQTLKSVSRRSFEQYEHEYEVEAAITAGFRKRAASGHAFTPIIAGGANACTIHYLDNNSPLDRKTLLLADVGAEVENYAADISRTYSLQAPSKRQSQVFEAVNNVQKFALEQLKPGVLIKDYEKLVENYMGEKLREIGLIKSLEHDAIREFYPHATSHHLGLDAHDVADYDRPLEKGMVITVEPGIYIPREGIGVRVEDDVLITETGVEVLSKALPNTLMPNGKI